MHDLLQLNMGGNFGKEFWMEEEKGMKELGGLDAKDLDGNAIVAVVIRDEEKVFAATEEHEFNYK